MQTSEDGLYYRITEKDPEERSGNGIEKITVEMVRVAGEMIGKDKSMNAISKKLGLDLNLAEQIVRMYVTHPGVTAEQVMTKLGL